jgi:hypothetical protein
MVVMWFLSFSIQVIEAIFFFFLGIAYSAVTDTFDYSNSVAKWQ